MKVRFSPDLSIGRIKADGQQRALMFVIRLITGASAPVGVCPFFALDQLCPRRRAMNQSFLDPATENLIKWNADNNVGTKRLLTHQQI